MESYNEKYTIRLIGPFDIFAPSGDRIDIKSKKSVAILSILSLSRDGLRSRSSIQDMLWGSREPVQAQSSLRREISTLKSLLSTPGYPEILRVEQSRISINLANVNIDVLSVLSGETAAPDLSFDTQLLEGLDIPDAEPFEEWLRLYREKIRELKDPGPASAINAPAQANNSFRGIVGHAPPSPALLASGEAPRLAGKPSIAVLPFVDHSTATGESFLGDGIAEDISINLGRYSSLFVIASASSLTYRNNTVPPGDICRQLGVRYLLNGTVRQSGDKIRITVSLSDGIAGQQLWAERFDGFLDDVFAMQDSITTSVGPRIDLSIEESERRRALSRPVQNADAYHLFWRANALFRQWGREPMLEAIQLAEQVLDLEPNNAWAASLAAFCHSSAYASSWSDDRAKSRLAAERYYALAMRNGGDDPIVLGYCAGTLVAISGDLSVAARLIDRALELQPISPATFFWGGWTDIAVGNLQRAQERFELALRLSPRSAARAFSITGVGVCLLASGAFAEAIAVLEEAVQHIPDYPITLAGLCVAAAASGRTAMAKEYANRLHAAGGVDQVLVLLKNPQQREMFLAGLALAEQG